MNFVALCTEYVPGIGCLLITEVAIAEDNIALGAHQ